nr:putative ribonuclease H-like domain-containing protein [Tanacetum cinerariifolium]
MSANDKFGLGYGDYRYGSILSYENEVLQSVFMNKASDLEDTTVNDRYADGMHVVPPPMTGNYMPSGPDVEIDYCKFTYGSKQTSADELDSKPSDYASCESDSSVETSTSTPKPIENTSNVVYEPKIGLSNAATLPNTDLPTDPLMPDLEDTVDTGIFNDAYDDEVEGAEADFSNLELIIVVWRLVDLPKGKHAIGTKWVYRNKKDERGIVVTNKATLVAQGYTQEEGINYDEVFALVARIEAIRLFLTYALFIGFIAYQMDVKSAFLYGTIEEEVYVCQPPGFEDPIFPNKVYKVEKALYGLHQAPRAWYETLSTYLFKNRFRRGIIYKTLFIKKDKDSDYAGASLDRKSTTGGCQFLGKGYAWIFDLDYLTSSMNYEPILVKNQANKSAGLKEANNSAGVVTDFNNLETTMSVNLTPTTRIHTIHPKAQILEDPKLHSLSNDVKSAFLYGTIDEEVYVSQPPGFVDPKFPNKVYKVVKALYGLHQAPRACMKTTSTRIQTQKPLVKDEEAADVDVHLYRFQVTPKTSHLHAVKRIFRYLKGQPKLGLWYPKVSSFDLKAYLDSDYAGANLDRKSTTGEAGCVAAAYYCG